MKYRLITDWSYSVHNPILTGKNGCNTSVRSPPWTLQRSYHNNNENWQNILIPEL